MALPKLNSQSLSRPAVQLPNSFSIYNAGVSSGAFDRALGNVVAISGPLPILAIGDAESTKIPVTQTSFLMGLDEQTVSIDGPSTNFLGLGGFYSDFAPIGGPKPLSWRDSDGVDQPSWEFEDNGLLVGGLFKIGAEGQGIIATIELQMEMDVPTAGLDLGFELERVPAVGPAVSLGKFPEVEVTVINSPRPYNMSLHHIGMSPNVNHRIVIKRIDNGTTDVTFRNLRVYVHSIAF